MESGFFYPYDTTGRLDAGKRALWVLPRKLKELSAVDVDDRGSAIRLNSTYLDVIDRWHTIRGAFRSLFATILFPLLIFLWIFEICFCFYAVENGVSTTFVVIGLCAISTVVWIALRYSLWPTLKREYFTYTHYPTRFNRITRMVHVFRHNGPGGVLSVPWDKAFFHIGRGTQDRSLLDLRCHVLDGDIVVDTFVVGSFFDTEDAIRQMWKFLLIYMEQGPKALPENTFITTSTSRKWLNCFIWANVFCNNFARVPLIRSVFVALITVTRWLVMQTCKDPVWPPEIEAESTLEEDDPYRLPEPSVSGELAAKDPKLWAAVQEIARRRRKRR